MASIVGTLAGFPTESGGGGALGASAAGGGAAAAAELANLRTDLRGLSRESGDWSVLVLSIAAAVGVPGGLVTWTGEALPLVETDLLLTDAISEIPNLGPYQDTLAALSRDGRLCLPISNRLPPPGVDAPSWLVVDGLRECQHQDVSKGAVQWMDTAAAAAEPPTRAPMAFPLPFAPVPAPPSRATLLANILALEQKP